MTLSEKSQWRHDLPTRGYLNFFWRCFVPLVKFSYWSKFHVNIIALSGFMTIFFIRDWPEIRKSEISPSEFYLISGDWGELGIPNLARKCYWMLQNARVTAFTVSWGIKLLPPPMLGLNDDMGNVKKVIVWTSRRGHETVKSAREIYDF